MVDSTATHQVEKVTYRVNPFVRGLLRLFLTISVPILLILISVRLVMSPLFLQVEYNRPGFPEDIYGFTTDDRLEYAPYALDYLLNDSDISYLGDLTFPDGSSLYNSSELHHMEDVKVVTRSAYLLLVIIAIAFTITSIGMWRQKSLRADLQIGLFNGALFTICLLVSIIFFALFAWDLFFDTFHEMFFEAGTWRFAFSDTLIRLFPEQFWFDAALVIGGMTLIVATIILFSTWRWGRIAN
ncbi:MAG: TIGR01906 family membrane protein [Aggregatilineales bacterium]